MSVIQEEVQETGVKNEVKESTDSELDRLHSRIARDIVQEV